MRSLMLVLILACLFGAAAIWQQTRTAALREERVLAAEIAAGEVLPTPSGVLGPGEAVVVIGRPSGATTPVTTPTATPGAGQQTGPAAPPSPQPGVNPDPRAPQPPDATPKPAPAPAPLGDFELTVAPGQSLSKIAHQHYGHAPVELVTKLAKYNGMADSNALRAGMKLKLPTLERLGVVLKP